MGYGKKKKELEEKCMTAYIRAMIGLKKNGAEMEGNILREKPELKVIHLGEKLRYSKVIHLSEIKNSEN